MAVRQVKTLKSTYSEFAVRLLKNVLSNGSQPKRIAVVLTFMTFFRRIGHAKTLTESGNQKVESQTLLSSNENKYKFVDFRDKQWVSDSSLIGDKILIVTNNKEGLPLFILGKLGTSKFNCGDKIQKKPCLFTFSSGKQTMTVDNFCTKTDR